MSMGSPEILLQTDAIPKDSFVMITLQKAPNSQIMYQHADLVLLYFDSPDATSTADVASTMTDEEEVGGPPNPKTETVYHILAIVESAHQNNVLVKVVIPNNVSKDEHRKWTRMTSVARAITTSGFRWYAARVIALTTMFREYQALMSFPDILLKEFLLSEDLVDGGECIDESETGKKLKRGEKKKLRKKRQRLAAKKSLLEKKEREKLEVPDSLMHAMEALYNETQLAALKDCLKATGITLIQGPPVKLTQELARQPQLWAFSA
eukprot:GHVN01034263.1.p1 GENE.GHVN01034263.1~~GHVN01034263.1.p1  ORF type:complete len:265 (+),score=42.02 GHVN01034263.1:110-904(+)